MRVVIPPIENLYGSGRGDLYKIDVYANYSNSKYGVHHPYTPAVLVQLSRCEYGSGQVTMDDARSSRRDASGVR